MKRILLSFSALVLIVGFSQAQFASNSFQARVDFSTPFPGNPQGVNSADLNGDGKPEMVVANLSGTSVSVFQNGSSLNQVNTGTFPSNFVLSTLSVNPSTINFADLNGDGKLEILVGYGSTPNNLISVFFNQYNGSVFNAGSFTRYDISTGVTSTLAPNFVVAEDLDLDGKKDLIATNYGGGSVSFLKNVGTATALSFNTAIQYTTGTNAAYIAIDDFDNDGKKDFAVSNWGSNSITTFKNVTSTVGTVALSSNNLTTATNPHYVKSGDIDNDGFPELLNANYTSGSVSIFKNTSTVGNMTFGTRTDIALSSTAYPQSVFTGDFDYDGKLDFGVAQAGLASIALFKNVYVGGAISTSSFTSSTSFTVNSSPVASAYADIDADLRPDILVTNYSSNNVSVLKNKNISPKPTLQPNVFNYALQGSNVSLTFSKGNGTRRLVVGRLNSSSTSLPTDTSWYNQKDTFGLGSNLGNNNFVVYADTGTSVLVKGLASGVTYTFTVYEYNGIGGFCSYYTTNPLSVTVTLSDVYYSKSSGALNVLSTWGPNTDGTGTSPASFGLNNTRYIVKNNSNPALGGNWFVTGTNTSVTFGDAVNTFNLTINPTETFGVDSFAVRSGITFTVQGTLISNKAYFDTLTTVQYTSSSVQNIPAYAYFNLVASGSTKSLTGNASARGTLLLSSDINTGSSNTLTLGSSVTQTGTLVRTSGNVVGNFCRWFAPSTNTGTTGLFPMSTGSTYRPVMVEFTAAPSTGGTITAQLIAGDPGNSGLPIYDFTTTPVVNVNKVGVNGVWRLTAGAGLTGGTYTGTVTGTGFFGINVVNELRLVRRAVSGSWSVVGTALTPSGTAAAPVVARSGLAAFGELGIGGDIGTNPLPVQFLSLEGKYKAGFISLQWKTAQELNSDLFVIERKSENDAAYSEIGKQKAAGNASSVSTYFFSDVNVSENKSYTYRIKEIDLDGSVYFSEPIVIKTEQVSSHSIIFPNPVNDHFSLQNASSPVVEVIILNALGDVVLSPMHTEQIAVAALSYGMYFIKLKYADGSMETLKLLKQ